MGGQGRGRHAEDATPRALTAYYGALITSYYRSLITAYYGALQVPKGKKPNTSFFVDSLNVTLAPASSIDHHVLSFLYYHFKDGMLESIFWFIPRALEGAPEEGLAAGCPPPGAPMNANSGSCFGVPDGPALPPPPSVPRFMPPIPPALGVCEPPPRPLCTPDFAPPITRSPPAGVPCASP